MKNTKAGVEDIPTPDEDVELELRTSAPQEEMEEADIRDREMNKKNKINIIKIK